MGDQVGGNVFAEGDVGAEQGVVGVFQCAVVAHIADEDHIAAGVEILLAFNQHRFQHVEPELLLGRYGKDGGRGETGFGGQCPYLLDEVFIGGGSGLA